MSDWQRVQTLFLAAVDMLPDERDRFLEGACADDVELREEIESLVATDIEDMTPIVKAVRQEAVSLFESTMRVGERFGSYRILREIGRGGMGAVYLALRDDEEFHQEVALKVVKRGMDTAEVLERFRHERQILANLEHPYIARLLDGGSTEDGVPYFVMEYIQGRPVDVYCRENALSVRARCELFLRILEAVDYAHRNLVIHRDLKPANILITARGAPKLLDFGVAKLLPGDLGIDRTRTNMTRPYTPWYASPEQVRGLPITTLSDVYSLGLILYELLTGQKAQPIDAQAPVEVERIICETQSPRPSLLVPKLSPDLDNIVLMALRKEPERRYHSVVQFADDLQRYLDGHTVMACPNSLRYRASKFVSRNRIQVASAVLVGAALITSLVISLAQTRRAEGALRSAEVQRLIAVQGTAMAEAARRDETGQRLIANQQRIEAGAQRDQAQRQRARAEQRVKDIYAMAEHTLFDVNDSIAKLPGSVVVRRDVVKTMLDYLENLEHEVGLDNAMREALSAAYYKIALIQGDAQSASMQDSQTAKASLLKAQILLLPAYKNKPNDPAIMLRLIEVRSSLADLQYRSGGRKAGIEEHIALLPVAHRLASHVPCTLNCRMQESILENELAYELLAFDPSAALEHANHGIALQRELLSKYPADKDVKQELGSLMAGAAAAYRSLGELERAADYYHESIDARESLLRDDPNDPLLRRNLLIAYGNYINVLGIPMSPNLGRFEEARLYALKGVSVARAMVAADPNNATARRDLGLILTRLGMLEPARDGIADSMSALEEARSLIEPIAKANPSSSEAANQVAYILEAEGHRKEAMGKPDEALASYRESIAILQPYWDRKDKTVTLLYIINEQDLALLGATPGDAGAALQMSQQALTQTEDYAGQPPYLDRQVGALGRAWSNLAQVQAKVGQMDQARRSARQAIELWNTVKQPGALSAYREAFAGAQAVLGNQ
jgi:tetratricopeptide (TPR) repeat protein